jgi:mxaJ protein
MSFRCSALILLVATTTLLSNAAEHRLIRVAADPNNLPFSNERLEGFENRIAELIARELNADLRYVWRAQRRGFFRETLKAGEADLVMGVPARFEMALTTKPYYRSTYVLVVPSGAPELQSLDDPRLRTLRIGVPLTGDDGANPPPVHGLVARGIITNLIGFTVYGDYKEANPPARVLQAVASGEIDVAVAWGPLAGYFARQYPAKLKVLPLADRKDLTGLPMGFDISIGVARKNPSLRDELNEVLETKATEIRAILREYGVPLLNINPAGELKL